MNGGERGDFSVEQEVNMFVAIRVAEVGEREPDLVLIDSAGIEILGKTPSWWQEERPSSNTEVNYVAVRVFENLDGGTYTLHNQHESDKLWLVDDLDGLGDNPWTYVTAISCCFSIPLGLIGMVLAIMVWSDKRKSPDQFVIIQDGSVIIGENTNIELELHEENAPEIGTIPEPFVSESPPKVHEETAQKEENWKSWDEG